MPKQKYAIVSDFHLEFRQNKEETFWQTFPKTEADVIICAGDITSLGLPDSTVRYHFEKLCDRFERVVYVPGNHEYYGTCPSDVAHRLNLLEAEFSPHLNILKAGRTFTYNGQRFIGDTMWFVDKPEVHIFRRMISDSFQIKELFPWCFTQSSVFLNYLRDTVRPDDIVITHHLPTDYGTASHWKLSPTQPYFLNDAAKRYVDNPNTIKPKAWIFGHTHEKQHFQLYGTEFICNPIGYPGENGHMPEAILPFLYEI